jgi:LPXTG-motif cell wall-anchored protein
MCGGLRPLYRPYTERREVSDALLALVIFLALALAALGGLFLYGWRRRKEKPPPGVKPLPRDDDW